MEFITPTILWGLGAIAIPIIIHLFYFRRFKKVYFSNVRQLKELKEETSSRNKIKNLLILLMRILAVASLVFAFAQPYFKTENHIKTGNSAISIFVDNSFSMNAQKDEVPLLDIAKEKARQIIEAYGESDRFQILTHDFKSKYQRIISKDDALALIDEITSTPSVKKLSRIINRQKQAILGKEENQIIYLLSDFQSSITDILDQQDTTIEINLLPIRSVQERNISIDDVSLDAPVPVLNQNNKLSVTIKNHSNEKAEGIRLTSIIAQRETPEGIYTISPEGTITDTIKLQFRTTGWHRVMMKISDYPIQFDDTIYAALHIPEKVKVLSINNHSSNKYLNALFKGLKQYQLENKRVTNVDYASLKTYNLIILNDLKTISSGLSAELDKYIIQGGNVLVFPDRTADIDSYNNFFNAMGANIFKSKTKENKSVSWLNDEEFVFGNVYEYVNKNIKLPVTQENFIFSDYQNRAQEVLLKYRDGSPYLTKYIHKDGRLYVCAAPLDLDVNNLSTNAEVFVPMIYKMAISSATNKKIAYIIGRDNVIPISPVGNVDEAPVTIKGSNEFIPGIIKAGDKTMIDLKGQITTAGYYEIMQKDKKIGELAFNYDRLESSLKVTPDEELERWAQNPKINLLQSDVKQNLSEFIKEKDKGKTLWWWFLVAALVFLGLETIILRTFKD